MTLDPERLGRVMTPEWTREREDTVWRALQQAETVSAPRWPWVLGATGLAAAVALLVLRPTPTPPSAVPEATEATKPSPVAAASVRQEPTPLSFRDGSRVFLDDVDSDVVVETVGPSLTETVLRRGGARFDVVPNPERQFRVDAGLVSVEVLGTEFSVRRGDGIVHVAVLRGSVAVEWPGGRTVLEAGMEGDYPPAPPGPAPDDTTAEAPEQGTPAGRSRARSKKPDVRDEVAPSVDALLDTADEARRRGDVSGALSSLRRIVRDHPRDARAPLAAFTMGRIEQGRGHHEVAAGHFARVRSMRKNSLSEHALAREVEAWAAAGQRGKARARAEIYLRKYPGGPHATQVEGVLEGAP